MIYMKRLHILIITLILSSLAFVAQVNAGCDSWFSFSSNCETNIPYKGNLSLSGWVDAASKATSGLFTNKPLSQFAQDIVAYFLTFVSLVGVIYIIYAGFQLMIGAWDEEKMKKTKKIILYVIIGVIIMWLAYSIVKWAINLTKQTSFLSWNHITWNLVPGVSAYTESDADTFRDYQERIRTAIQNLEAELRVNGSVTVSNIQSIKSLVQAAYDRLPDNTEVATENATAKRAVDMYLDIAIKNPDSTQKVGDAISKTSAFIDGAKISSISGNISATPSEGNAPLNVSFMATEVTDPSWTTPWNNNYIWWIRENGGVRRELGRWPSLNYTFSQEWTFTVNLDVISGSRNSKGKTDVLPLSVSKSISVKPKLGEIILLINGVNVSNLDSIKINPTLWKMWVVFDATASRAIGNGSITKTIWDFGNGNDSLPYQWKPVVERQIYSNQGNYTVQLKIVTNDGKEISKSIQLVVRDPSAVIQLENELGHVGDEMHFSALSYFTNNNNIEYSWQIQNDTNAKILKSAAGNTLNYKFDTIGTYIVTLNARSPNGAIDSDSRRVTIESRDPIVNLESPVPMSQEKPNTFVFDASKSYDPDTMSTKWLTYTWRLDGQKTNLENITHDGAKWSLTFDSIGTHTISVTVANPYGKVTTVEKTFTVDSVLSVSMLIAPQVAPIGSNITFVARSENADFYEWNFNDGSSPLSGNEKLVQHVFKKTGIYTVSLIVSTKEWGKTNQIQRKVYVTDTSSPFAIIGMSNSSNSVYEDREACGTWAIVANRSESTTLDGSKSVNIDGSNNDLSYTWNYFGKTKTIANFSEKFGELWCFPIKLTVRSNKNGSSHTTTQYLYLKNQAPEITGISTNVDTTKKDSQKVLVKVSANWATDPDGVITSYIWYYTTESDKEPQNVQITQKPEITFVLPNITEKYYFGVILEDNDGARTNSADASNEQTPLILSNQNGNIYLPLITLSTPKTTVLAGENVHLSAEAKTIVGTNITNKSEYAWDFDGDGKIDQKTQSPSVDYTYKNSWNYTLKVRVTYNGVSNTKYQTIYVKNALKASARGYHLPDGSFYFLNTSEGPYDKALWTIWGNSIESLYSATIEPWVSIESGKVGAITVSSNNTDTNTADIILSDIEEVTGSWVYYQSSPKAENDTIHIKGSSDKLLLSLLGNAASRYVIDTDISIDSDLDGVTDNDADNKNVASYTDGSVFVVSDFWGSRNREQKMKVTLFQWNTVIQTKILTLVFDFISDTTTSLSWETLVDLWSWGISNYDRERLDQLSSLIRSLDDSNRVILMKEYNTLVENWDDSFSKSKVLIDIQTIVDSSTLPNDKKTSITHIINDLLSGDSRATDDITLAARLIQWLVSKSPNAGILWEKLSAIESHPQSLETNIILAKEIFDLIQPDESIDDETKKYIYNQLSVIKSGWTQSVPPEEITAETSSGNGVLWFIGGVVKVFFLIIGIVIFVILIGYVFYRVSRKNESIGFQDFLIDSVFHAGKWTITKPVESTTLNTKGEGIPPEQQEIKTINEDALAEKSSPSPLETTSPVADPMTTLPKQEIRTSKVWEIPKPTNNEPSPILEENNNTPTPIETVWVPDWLKVPQAPTPYQEQINKEGAHDENKEEGILPTSENTDPGDVLATITPPTEAVIQENIPDWLKPDSESWMTEGGNALLSDPMGTEIQDGMEPEPTTSTDQAIPSWLIESVSPETKEIENKESQPPKEAKKKPTKKKWNETSHAPDTSNTPTSTEDWINTQNQNTGNIPDWLK